MSRTAGTEQLPPALKTSTLTGNAVIIRPHHVVHVRRLSPTPGPVTVPQMIADVATVCPDEGVRLFGVVRVAPSRLVAAAERALTAPVTPTITGIVVVREIPTSTGTVSVFDLEPLEGPHVALAADAIDRLGWGG